MAEPRDAWRELFSREDFDGVVTSAAEELRSNPENVDARSYLASALFRLEDYESAAREFRHAIGLAPDHYKAIYYLGLIAEKKGDSEEARRQFETALKLSPDFELAAQKLGRDMSKSPKTDRQSADYVSELSLPGESQLSEYSERYARREEEQFFATWQAKFNIWKRLPLPLKLAFGLMYGFFGLVFVALFLGVPIFILYMFFSWWAA